MFRVCENNKIEICCMGLLEYICEQPIKLSGVLTEYPTLSIAGRWSINFCPSCGAKLNPTIDNYAYIKED